MAKKQTTSRRPQEKRTAPQRREPAEQQPSRRNDVIRCENCGEDYSVTYKRCPFCDERPGRTGISGSRVSGGSSVHPVQVIGLVISLILIISALFIVFKYVGPLVFGDKSGGGTSSGTSQSGISSQPDGSSSVSSSDPGGASSGDISSGGDVSDPVSPPVTVTGIQLSKTDITLQPKEESQLMVTVTPAGAAQSVVWTSSDPTALTVEQDGSIKNVNSGTEKVKVTVTAAAGDKSAECTVYCKPVGGGTTTPDPGVDTPTPPDNGTVAPNSKGTVVNAGSGLNIRSGPGSSYDKVASAPNGAEVTVLAEENGWYKIDYGGGKTGYVSRDYISVKK